MSSIDLFKYFPEFAYACTAAMVIIVVWRSAGTLDLICWLKRLDADATALKADQIDPAICLPQISNVAELLLSRALDDAEFQRVESWFCDGLDQRVAACRMQMATLKNVCPQFGLAGTIGGIAVGILRAPADGPIGAALMHTLPTALITTLGASACVAIILLVEARLESVCESLQFHAIDAFRLTRMRLMFGA